MKEYVERLVRCGYAPEKAIEICRDFSKNLRAYDLELFVKTVEEFWAKKNVEKV